MRAICAGRTVIIIAHRLVRVRDADRIVVVDRGQIIEQGSHEELLAVPGGQYAHLWSMQAGAPAATREGASQASRAPGETEAPAS